MGERAAGLLKTVLLNLALGIVPLLIYGASIASGVEDDARHRRVFSLVYGLWSLTLAGWNWQHSSHIAWVVGWAVVGVVMLIRSR